MTSPNKRKGKKPASEEKKKARSVSKTSEQEKGEGYKNPSLAGTKHGTSGGGGISIPSAAGGILVGGPAGGSFSTEQPSEGARSQRRRRAEVVAPPGVDPNCRVCGREFGSWKALFGHMRSHPERQWRGAFPPPVEQRHSQEEQAGAGEGGAEEGRVAWEFDLNYRPEDAGTSSSLEEGGGDADWDLNALPPAAASGDDEKRGAA
ncbi:hypothetical protein UlMin_025664 [Ulmus minor]